MEETKMVPLPSQIGHKREAKLRTQDIHLDEQVSFGELGLSAAVLKGLIKSGFDKPSPIQLCAIPLGRCGLDLVVQAKSGTGKTCVFTITALEGINVKVKALQVLVLAPTREIALQIQQVFEAIGQDMKGLKCHSCIGGLPLNEDKQHVKTAHVMIATPGRLRQLMELEVLDTRSVRLIVLDEADKLMDDTFQDQINWIYTGLPESKQVIATSATYTEQLVTHLCKYMYNPTFVRLNSADPVLLGVRQYKKEVPEGLSAITTYNNKVKSLIQILSNTTFQQCLVFSNLQTRAENLSKLLNSRGWPAAHIAGSQEQTERIAAMTRLKSYDCRILISTDLTSRGIDADKIDVVINLDLPFDFETYLHRVGRAGRFGSNGAAISLVAGTEVDKLEAIAKKIKTHIKTLPEELSSDFIQNPTQLLDDEIPATQIDSFQIITADDGTIVGDKYVTHCDETQLRFSNNQSNMASKDTHLDDVQKECKSDIIFDGQKPVHGDKNFDMRRLTAYTTAELSFQTNTHQLPTRYNQDVVVNRQMTMSPTHSKSKNCTELSVIEKITAHPDFLYKPKLPSLVKSHKPAFSSLKEAKQFVQHPASMLQNIKPVQYIDSEDLKKAGLGVRQYLEDVKLLQRLEQLGFNSDDNQHNNRSGDTSQCTHQQHRDSVNNDEINSLLVSQPKKNKCTQTDGMDPVDKQAPDCVDQSESQRAFVYLDHTELQQSSIRERSNLNRKENPHAMITEFAHQVQHNHHSSQSNLEDNYVHQYEECNESTAEYHPVPGGLYGYDKYCHKHLQYNCYSCVDCFNPDYNNGYRKLGENSLTDCLTKHYKHVYLQYSYLKGMAKQ